MKYPFIIVEGDGDSHIGSTLANYSTLCGLDGDDEGSDQRTIGMSDKVSCKHCIGIWLECRAIPRRDLVE